MLLNTPCVVKISYIFGTGDVYWYDRRLKNVDLIGRYCAKQLGNSV